MNMPRTRTTVWCCAAVASLIAVPARADGELDTTFGRNGVVRIDSSNSSHWYLRAAAVVNGAIEAAGLPSGYQCSSSSFPNLFIVKLSLDGEVMGHPSSIPQQAIRCPSSLIVDPSTGDIFVAGVVKTSVDTRATAIALFDSAGRLIGTYSFTGRGSSGPWPFCSATRLLLDNQGRFVAPCGKSGEFGFQGLAPLRLSVLDQDSGLTGEFLSASSFGYHYPYGVVITQDSSSGAYYFATVGICLFASSCGTRPIYSVAPLVMRFNSASGEADRNYGNGGVAVVSSLSNGGVSSITLDGSGNVLIGGVGSGYIARLDPTGTLDESFGNHGVVQNLGASVVELLTDKRNRVYALEASQLSRFGVDGTRDPSFSSGSDVLLLNGPSSFWSSMQFADSTQSSVYLMGGAGCATSCTNVATSAVIAKVLLFTNQTRSITTTALNASATTIDSGETVTLSAFVSGASPTGSVTFKDGSTVLASENLTAATTRYSTSALAVGKHSITAVYSGDDHNATSSSQVVTETVNALPSGGGAGGGNTGSGGGGAFAGLELFGMLLLWLWRALGSWLVSGRFHLHRSSGCQVSIDCFFRGIYLYPLTFVRGAGP